MAEREELEGEDVVALVGGEALDDSLDEVDLDLAGVEVLGIEGVDGGGLAVDGFAVHLRVLRDPAPEGLLLAAAAPLVEGLADVLDGDEVFLQEPRDDAVPQRGGLGLGGLDRGHAVGTAAAFVRWPVAARRGSALRAVVHDDLALPVARRLLDQGERLVALVGVIGSPAEHFAELVGHRGTE